MLHFYRVTPDWCVGTPDGCVYNQLAHRCGNLTVRALELESVYSVLQIVVCIVKKCEVDIMLVLLQIWAHFLILECTVLIIA